MTIFEFWGRCEAENISILPKKKISDTQTPDNSTWDVEERGQIIAKNQPLSKHVCGGNKLDAMYIDTRTVEEDIPWHEVNQLMTKNTPL